MDNDDEMPVLSESALSALIEFYTEREAHEVKFTKLQDEGDSCEALSMDIFAERWQDSQFWYDDATARELAAALLGDAGSDHTITVVSAPSVFLMVKKLLKQSGKPTESWPRLLLLEFDRRFEIFGDEFVFYDFNHPLRLPLDLKAAAHHIICDPPFLSDDCQAKALTVRWLSKSWPVPPERRVKESRLIVCTGERMEKTVIRLYRPQGVGITTFEPVHSKQQLSNEFICYANFQCDMWAWKQGSV